MTVSILTTWYILLCDQFSILNTFRIGGVSFGSVLLVSAWATNLDKRVFPPRLAHSPCTTPEKRNSGYGEAAEAPLGDDATPITTVEDRDGCQSCKLFYATSAAAGLYRSYHLFRCSRFQGALRASHGRFNILQIDMHAVPHSGLFSRDGDATELCGPTRTPGS